MIAVAEAVVSGPCTEPGAEDGRGGAGFACGGDVMKVVDCIGDCGGKLVGGKKTVPTSAEKRFELEAVDLWKEGDGKLTLYVLGLGKLLVVGLCCLNRVV